jgi:hypothetical protein
MLSVVMLRVIVLIDVMLITIIKSSNAECHYGWSSCAECHYVDCHYG